MEIKKWYNASGSIWRKIYFSDSLRNRDDGPACILYYENGKIESEAYYQNDMLHRLEGPAIIIYNEDGSINLEEYWLNGEIYEDMFQWLVAVGSLKGV